MNYFYFHPMISIKSQIEQTRSFYFQPLGLFGTQQYITDMNINLPKQVPFLPGHVFTNPYRENFHKTQQFSYVDGSVQEKRSAVQEEHDQYLIDSMKNEQYQLNLSYGKRSQPDNDYIPRVQPPWLKYDRQVLRFYAYFQEHVVESKLQNYRLRKVVIYHYLSDETILVIEPRVSNSGIPQGVFIKRQKIPKELGKPGDHYQYKDFSVGDNINFFERIFRIYDCDQFTRSFYEYMEIPQGEPEQEPTDDFDNYMEKKELKVNPADTKQYKEYFEVKLGGGHPNNGLAKYLANDRKVLSFKALWQDDTLEGGVNYFTINYFLADDSVEVKETRTQNSGRDPFPLLLRRQKLPKIPINTHYPGMGLKKEEFYTSRDFILGETVYIFGRECYLFDCDDFTKKFYTDVFSITQKPIEMSKIDVKKIFHEPPPYNGYGTLEDSLGSVYALEPKRPKKDVIKMFTSDQNILRFEARLISQTKDYNSRKFIVNFFCGDDTIQVYQEADKNSGVWGGKFLERMKHRDEENTRYLNQVDFQIGSIVKLGVYSFQLLRADEFTAKYMTERPEVFPEANLHQTLNKIKALSKSYKSYDDFLIWLIKTIDPKNKGSINYEDFYSALSTQYFLSHQEVYSIFRECFKGSTKNQIDMKDLWKVFGGA